MLAPMTEPDPDAQLPLAAASEAVRDIGWRYLLGTLALSVPSEPTCTRCTPPG